MPGLREACHRLKPAADQSADQRKPASSGLAARRFCAIFVREETLQAKSR